MEGPGYRIHRFLPSVSKVLRTWADAGLWEAWQVGSICIIHCNICMEHTSQLGSQGSVSEEKEKETKKKTNTHFIDVFIC